MFFRSRLRSDVALAHNQQAVVAELLRDLTQGLTFLNSHSLQPAVVFARNCLP